MLLVIFVRHHSIPKLGSFHFGQLNDTASIFQIETHQWDIDDAITAWCQSRCPIIANRAPAIRVARGCEARPHVDLVMPNV